VVQHLEKDRCPPAMAGPAINSASAQRLSGPICIMNQPAFRKLEIPQTAPEFSLVLGGPLYQFYLRTRLARPPIDLVRRRILALCLICWIPPFLLSLFSGIAFGRVKVPFLLDIGAHVRFLCSLPLLTVAELVVQRRIPSIVRQFFDRRIIATSEQVRFDKLVSSTMRFRNSAFIEILLILSAFAGFWMWQEYPTLGGSTWYVAETNGKLHFTAAGYWYVLISLPASSIHSLSLVLPPSTLVLVLVAHPAIPATPEFLAS
jgi:hypothetical protein